MIICDNDIINFNINNVNCNYATDGLHMTIFSLLRLSELEEEGGATNTMRKPEIKTSRRHPSTIKLYSIINQTINQSIEYERTTVQELACQLI